MDNSRKAEKLDLQAIRQRTLNSQPYQSIQQFGIMANDVFSLIAAIQRVMTIPRCDMGCDENLCELDRGFNQGIDAALAALGVADAKVS